jgi:hypothetical protein
MQACIAVKCIQEMTLCDFSISCHALMKLLHSGSQVSLKAIKTKLRECSPQANYTDRAAAAYR